MFGLNLLIRKAISSYRAVFKIPLFQQSYQTKILTTPPANIQMDNLKADQQLPPQLDQPLVWVDLEMTGLSVFQKNDQIIEIAVLLTDGQMNTIIHGPELVIHAPKDLLDSMDEWCTNTHKASGLYDKSLNSTISLEDAQTAVLTFLQQHGIKPRQAVLAGNSIHQDKKFLEKQMPLFNEFLHYRIVDVSTIKELARRWKPEVIAQAPAKKGGHRALDDIIESIEELKYYREVFFKE